MKNQSLSHALSRTLADTVTLYTKTQGFHWNVTGPFFQSLHSLFEAQYAELGEAADEIAERIRALGQLAPGSFSEFSKLATIQEAKEPLQWRPMLQALLKDHETLAQSAHQTWTAASTAKDEASADLMTRRIQAHEKAAWMLRSTLQD